MALSASGFPLFWSPKSPAPPPSASAPPPSLAPFSPPINGLTLGSIYGLIAIGYTMVFGIIGMVNFAHGDVFMLSTFIALIFFLMLTQVLGMFGGLALFIVLLIGMALTSLWGWAIERVAYRPLRGSFRLAPLISAIGMSIFLSNFVQVAQGPRNKPRRRC